MDGDVVFGGSVNEMTECESEFLSNLSAVTTVTNHVQ